MDKIANGFAFVLFIIGAILLIAWAWESGSLAGFVLALACLALAIGNGAAFTR